MSDKRITIYDIAKELGISGSYVSRALNDHSSISDKMKKLVKEKAHQLNYKHNSHAANLRNGSSKTIGVVVPLINQNFFSEAIAGIEEACFENGHSLIICQSGNSLEKEILSVNTLIHHNVDCILISISGETQDGQHLKEIVNHKINLVQFDRYLDNFEGFKIINDNKEASISVVRHLIEQDYTKIAFIGGPDHLSIYQERKNGFIEAIKTAGLSIPDHFVVENIRSKEGAGEVATHLLQMEGRPDAIFTVSDYSALGVLQVATAMHINVPDVLGIFGFANEPFTELIKPSLSSVDQRSKELGKYAANFYFNNMSKGKILLSPEKHIIHSRLMIRESSNRTISSYSTPVKYYR